MHDCNTSENMINTKLTTHITILCSINILPSLIAIIGNALCITTIVKTPLLQTTSNVWVAALCVSDLIVGIIAQPLYYASLASFLTGQQIRKFWFAARVNTILLSNTSFFLAYFVTLDRCFAICKPYLYRRVANIKGSIIVACLAFLLSIPSVIIDIFAKPQFLIFGPILVSLLTAQIVTSYVVIYREVLAQRRSIATVSVSVNNKDELRRRKVEKKKTYQIMIIIITLFICYSPMCITSIVLKDASKEVCVMSKSTIAAVIWGQFFMLLNSSINPLIYCLKMKEVRNAAIRIVWPENVSILRKAGPSRTNSKCTAMQEGSV